MGLQLTDGENFNNKNLRKGSNSIDNRSAQKKAKKKSKSKQRKSLTSTTKSLSKLPKSSNNQSTETKVHENDQIFNNFDADIG